MRTRFAALLLLAVSGLVGCVTTPLHLREWYAVETRHFSIWSSLGRDDTLELAIDLERFRAVVQFFGGAGASSPASRTQVYAFDGRGLTRPFDVRGVAGIFLPSLRGGGILLRAGGGWRRDATRQLRHEYAHFLFRNTQGLDRPLWYDEGFAQLASTIEVRDSSVTVGRVRKDHIELLENRLWIPGPELVELSSLGDFDSVNREIFRAQSWALVHSLLLGRRDPGGARARAQAYLDRVAAGGSHAAALKREFGADAKGLVRRLAREVRAGDFLLSEMRAEVPEQGAPPALRPLEVGEVTTVLGWLAISLGRPTLASSYFEKAVAENPQDPNATAGLGAVAKLRGEWHVAARYYGAALVGAPDDAIVQLEAGGYYHTRAARAEDAAERGRLLALAREHYGRSIALDGSLAEPHAVLGATYLLPGQKPRGGLASLDQSAALLPASLEIELLRANLSARMELLETARRRALSVYSRTHSHDLADAALRLIEAIDR